jgi:hypothetical protein
MVNDYKITSRSIDGAIYLRYEKDDLTAVALELNAPLREDTWRSFCEKLPLQRTWLHNKLSGHFEIKELTTAKSVQDKVVMFCSAYKHFRGVPYKPTTLEKANLKNVMVNRELLTTFFKSPLANFNMKNYIDRINITRDWQKNGMNQHLFNAFPDEYDAKFEATLEAQRLGDYWAHLRDKGWKKDERGIWKKQA